jgi:ABC-type lipoprotein export system ATPase subunit
LRFSKRKDDGRVDYLLDKFDIRPIANETTNKISGGEAQRVAIARAMMNEPRIILADEPTGNLDTENTENVMEMIGLIRRDFGATIILATHDKELAYYATAKVFLEKGKAVIEK